MQRQGADSHSSELEHDEFPPEAPLVSAKLDIEGEALSFLVENLTDVGGTISFGTLIQTPRGLFLTESVGSRVLGPGEQTRILLRPSEVDGLDLSSDDWTDARVNFQVQLDDGRAQGMPVEIFAERGRVAPLRSFSPSGQAFGVPELDAPVEQLVDKQAGNFTMCFANVVTYSGVTENDLDFHRNPTQMVFAAGMRLNVRDPNGTVLSTRFLDTNGCTSLPRVQGTWSFALQLTGQNFPVTGVTITARQFGQANPPVPFQFTANVDANFAPPRVPVTMTGLDGQLQAAYTLVLHTLLRATTLGAVVPATSLNIQMRQNNGDATNYSPSTRTINVTPTSGATTGSAVRRRSVSHETGHWLHLTRVPASNTADYTYGLAGHSACVGAMDGCLRSSGGTHEFTSIEWNGPAHVEGIASFFTAIAFNTASNGANCFIPDLGAATRSCEALGTTLAACCEWADASFFTTGNEHDWTKMYWDFVADEGQNFLTYLNNEAARTGWTLTNRGSKVFEGLTTTMRDALRRAAIGNIQEGSAH